MSAFTLRDLATLVRADAPEGAERYDVRGASIDSRSLRPNDVFVPLPGEHTDGHAYVDDVLARGVASLCARDAAAGRTSPLLLVVDDPLEALTAWARGLRGRWSGRLVGVTGTNGKTTTKELTAAALGARYATLRTTGNQNNHIGVPLTLAALLPPYQAAVVEMGMNHLGEIRALAAIARPTVAIITNVGVAHAEGVGGRDMILRAKMEIAEGLGPDDTLIVDGDDTRLVTAAQGSRARVVRVGVSAHVDVRATGIAPQGTGTTATLADGSVLTLALPGEHNVRNALCALAAAETCGVPRADALGAMADVRPPGGRSRVVTSGSITLLDDSYNANPSSMTAALEVLVRLPGRGRRIAVLGEMRELGEETGSLHAALGRAAATARVDVLIAAGAWAETVVRAAREAGLRDATAVPSADEALQVLRGRLAPHDIVLVKGSRAARMEVVVNGILAGPLVGGAAG